MAMTGKKQNKEPWKIKRLDSCFKCLCRDEGWKALNNPETLMPSKGLEEWYKGRDSDVTGSRSVREALGSSAYKGL